MSGALSALSDFVGWTPEPSDQVSVIILRGTKAWAISTWTAATIRMGVEIMPWTATLSMTTQGPDAATTIDLVEGDSCQLLIGSTLVFTGYVQTIVEDIAPGQHSIEVQLASKSIDLVECAAEFSTFQMNSTNALAIARAVSAFAGIQVISVDGAGDTDIKAFSAILTETAYEMIERVTRLAAVLFYDRPDGNICMSQAGSRRAASGFVLGDNIERIQRVRSMAGRFSSVQAINIGAITLFETPDESNLVNQMTANTAPFNAQAFDKGVNRTRNMLIPVEIGDPDYAIARQRVQWEVNRRYARAYPVMVTSDSWRDKAGNLWLPNTLVPVSTMGGTQQLELLIGEMVLRQAIGEGTHVDVTLMDPKAFLPQPVVNPIYQDPFYQAWLSGQGQATQGSS
ncbi:phage baseplate assembly protein [Komagataeibacter xylinus]|uniref:phage baseplate assembly protein n=1 Tax=Komagataeibacter xylinus TaxID=28448 RepID=UPI00102FCB62|nr:phage tail protein [Komagataeibacter xylinus]